ncbi:kelch-like protein 10 [Scomber japonicus]|uniref:kelch-like protein 10 n=1 Tax=Scomber japonicus TaxID=13676 RepID=UPI002306380F|nr:kelch-like protein 10 [Scomber japonicus]
MTSAALNELRREERLCDVVIKVDDVEFKAHKVILCGCSAYFRALFTGAWATSEKQVYNIPGVLPEMMNLIICYAYTDSVPVTEDNVVEILAAADQFLVPGIVQACSFFLEDQLCLNNCIGIWKLVDFYHCPDLKYKVFLYILYHFLEVVNASKEFLDLSVQELAAIIENDHLNVRREDKVFETILYWINHLPAQRRGYISELLPKVRLGFMTADYLQHNVIDNDLVKDSFECIPTINDAVNAFLDIRAYGLANLDYSSPLIRPRLPPAILLATGGKDGSTPVTSVQAYDLRADRWWTLSTEEICRAHHGTAVLNGSMYLIGGCSREAHLNTVLRFDLVTRTWHEVGSMEYCRCYVSVAVLNGCIYAMGGYNGHAYYNTVECYRQETNQWTMAPPMRTKRCGASSATLNGKIYMCGGFNGRRSLSSAECYDPETRQWTLISHMRNSRSGLGVVAYKDCIYAVGGTFTGTSHLCSAEAYNPQTNRWHAVPSMSAPRSYFGIEVVDEQLFVVGGFNGVNTMMSVERYDEEAGMWYDASNTRVPCSGLSCSVLHGNHAVVEQLFPRDATTLANVQQAAGGSV